MSKVKFLSKNSYFEQFCLILSKFYIHMKLFRFITAGIVLASVAISTQSCGNETEQKKDSSTIVKDSVEVVKPKTREELIINRKEMSFAKPDSVTDFEWKHTPDITLGKSEKDGTTAISVKIGSKGIVHPSVTEHWIDFITLVVNGTELEKKEFNNDGAAPEASFTAKLKKGDVVTVNAGCNLHGIWKNSVTVK